MLRSWQERAEATEQSLLSAGILALEDIEAARMQFWLVMNNYQFLKSTLTGAFDFDDAHDQETMAKLRHLTENKAIEINTLLSETDAMETKEEVAAFLHSLPVENVEIVDRMLTAAKAIHHFFEEKEVARNFSETFGSLIVIMHETEKYLSRFEK